MKIKLLINVDCKPDFTRIKKGTVLESIYEMQGGYVMVSYKGSCYPVPPGTYVKLDEEEKHEAI